jgi:hypothetical protein
MPSGGFVLKLRLGVSIIAIAFLAACAGSTPNLNSGGSPVAGSAARRPAAKGPSFAITIILPDGASGDARRDHATAGVQSLRATTNVKNRKYVYIYNAGGSCTIGEANGAVTGCGIETTGTTSYVTQKATFDFYSSKGGKGCLLATGKFKGSLIPNTTVPVTLKPQNTKKCWK